MCLSWVGECGRICEEVWVSGRVCCVGVWESVLCGCGVGSMVCAGVWSCGGACGVCVWCVCDSREREWVWCMRGVCVMVGRVRVCECGTGRVDE